MATHYMTGAQRIAQEDAELEAEERNFNEQYGPVGEIQSQQEPNEPLDTPVTPNETVREVPQEPTVDWEKRYKDLQSHSTKKENELKAKLEEAGIEPEETDKVAEMEAQLAELRAKDEQREIEDLVAQAQATVGAVHPDFVQVINSPDFAQWIQGQPQVYHEAIYADRPDAQLSIDALTLFKVQSGFNDRKAAEAQSQMQDQAALSVGGGHREAPQSRQEKIWTWNEIQSLTPSQYDKLESEIDKAISEGRVQ